MFKPFLALLIAAMAVPCTAENYCLAIRGNGENAPAHWGAISSVVEKMGLPSAMAGGSSGSITMFLMDAIATNKFVRDAREEERGVRAALLLKSLEGFAEHLQQTSEFRDFKLFFSEWQQISKASKQISLENLYETFNRASAEKDTSAAVELIRKNQNALIHDYQSALQVGLLNQKTLASLQSSITRIVSAADPNEAMTDIQKSRFFLSELIETVRVFGAFDATKDSNLFFRPGIVDFGALAEQLGRVAQFYAALDTTAGDDALWTTFFEQCTERSRGRQWPEFAAGGQCSTALAAGQPDRSTNCDKSLQRLISSYFSHSQGNFSDNLTGRSIKSFPATAVLTGSASDEFMQARQRYSRSLDSNFGMGFRLSNPEEVHFGYWGHSRDLQRIEQQFAVTTDAKSRRFLPLGNATWAQVLQLSPAEPGLSPFQPFQRGNETLISAGGWSDLSPVLVLQAAGCGSVVYVTRTGPEAKFSQQVAKRLIRDATVLRDLYDLDNANSSIKRALNAAAAVVCTNWDSYSIFGGIRPLINDGYTAPFYIPPNSPLSGNSTLTPRADITLRNADGTPKYLGCF